MTNALRPDDPATLGPFRLTARLREHEAGVVFLGHDSAGRPAAISVLHAGAAADAAARDRLLAALDDLTREAPHDVLAAAPADPVPWVATTGEDPSRALALLDAVALSHAVGLTGAPGGPSDRGAQSSGVTGPEFAPHWSGTPAATRVVPAAPPRLTSSVVAPANSRRSLAILAACVAVAVVVVAGGGALASYLGGQDDSDTRATATSEPAPSFSEPAWTTDPQASPEPSHVTPEPPSPTKASPRPTGGGSDGPPGLVAGPTFGADEPTYLMDLEGFPFDFRVPRSWGCMRSDKGGPGAARWVCIDEGYIFGSKTGDPPGGIIEVRECPAPCGSDEWATARETLSGVHGDWRRVDETTLYAEWQVPDGSGRMGVAMSHVFSAESDGSADTHVGVRLTGSSDELPNMHKIINEIRANTP